MADSMLTIRRTRSRSAQTLFGNVMARAISCPNTRYSIPLDTLWPRMTHVLAEHALRRVDDAAIFVDFCVVSVAGAAMVAVTSLGAAFSVEGSGVRAVVFGVDGLLAVVVFMRLAVTAARSFAEEVASCIDLSRDSDTRSRATQIRTKDVEQHLPAI
jgi:hypothetical protein